MPLWVFEKKNYFLQISGIFVLIVGDRRPIKNDKNCIAPQLGVEKYV